MKSVADYTFIEPIWAGNHGDFWRARPPARLGDIDGEFVAVKILESQATEQDFERMANELRVHAEIDSEYIAPIVDAGHQDGRLFFTTTFFKDGSLGTPACPLDTAQIISVTRDAVLGAHAMHECGVAHRDIKPSNIMLTRQSDGELRGVIADLGLAQIIRPGQTVTGIGPVGTIEYIAPELVRGEVASRASDIWAFGVTLHRSLAGQSVYEGLPEDSLLDALRHVISSRPVIDASLLGSHQKIIERCLAEDPADRYSTAEELAAALDASELS